MLSMCCRQRERNQNHGMILQPIFLAYLVGIIYILCNSVSTLSLLILHSSTFSTAKSSYQKSKTPLPYCFLCYLKLCSLLPYHTMNSTLFNLSAPRLLTASKNHSLLTTVIGLATPTQPCSFFNPMSICLHFSDLVFITFKHCSLPLPLPIPFLCLNDFG